MSSASQWLKNKHRSKLLYPDIFLALAIFSLKAFVEKAVGEYVPNTHIFVAAVFYIFCLWFSFVCKNKVIKRLLPWIVSTAEVLILAILVFKPWLEKTVGESLSNKIIIYAIVLYILCVLISSLSVNNITKWTAGFVSAGGVLTLLLLHLSLFCVPHSVKSNCLEMKQIDALTNGIDESQGVTSDIKDKLVSLINNYKCSEKEHAIDGLINLTNVSVFILLVGAVLCPIILLVVNKFPALPSAKKKPEFPTAKEYNKKDKMSDFHFMLIHFIPYAVLSLAMVFELHKVIEGEGEGMAAIAGIIILFLMAELGAGVLQTVHDMKTQSKLLGQQMNRNAITFRGLPFIGPYAKIVTSESSVGTDIQKNIEGLIDAWSKIAKDYREGNRGLVLRTLLSTYFKEEKKDVTGDLNKNQVPAGAWPFEGDKPVKDAAIFMATNISYYTSFLSETVKNITRSIYEKDGDEKQRVPCAATVTTFLPTHFYNYPRLYNKHNEEYYENFYKELRMPNYFRKKGPLDIRLGIDKEGLLERYAMPSIYSYYWSLVNMTNQKDGAVYRAILVGNDNKGYFDAATSLWSQKYWEYEKNNYYLRVKNNKLVCSCKSPEQYPKDYEEQLSFEDVQPPKRTGAGLVIPDNAGKWEDTFIFHAAKDYSLGQNKNKVEKVLLDGDQNSHAELACDYYNRNMHPDDGKNAGETVVCKISKNDFEVKLKMRPDIFFIGTRSYNKKYDEGGIWREALIENEAEDSGADLIWDVAILATMSPSTETMFLTVVHKKEIVNKLWNSTAKAIKDLNPKKLKKSQPNNA